MKRILLVTERCARHTLPVLLAHSGYDVVEPRVPSEAATLARAVHIDLVVIGHCVPRAHRNTVAALITEFRPELPIICVSDDPVSDQPTHGSLIMTSCSTLLWAIEHAASVPSGKA